MRFPLPALLLSGLALACGSPDPAAHFNLARMADRAADDDEAREHYLETLRLEPGHEEARYYLANLSLRTGELREAAEHYSRVAEQRPASSKVRLWEAVALAGAGDSTTARQRLEAALDDFPGEGDLLQALARLLAASPADEVRDGQRALDLALLLFRDRKTLEHAEAVAMAFAELGHFEQAIKLQQSALKFAEDKGRSALVPGLQENLALYQRGEPCRTPWQKAAAVYSPPRPD